MPNSTALSATLLDIQFQILENLKNATVIGGLLGRDYERAVLTGGGRARFETPGILTAAPYDPAVTTTTPTTSTVTIQDLIVDQTHYVETIHHDIEGVVVNGNTSNPFKTNEVYARERAYALASIVDTTLAGQYTAFGVPDIAVDIRDAATANPWQALSTAQRYLRERSIPQDGRAWVVISPKMAEKLQNNVKGQDLQAVIERLGVQSDSALARNYLGQMYGFSIFMSNNLVDADGTAAIQRKMIYGHPMYWQAAFTSVTSEVMRSQTKLADLKRDSLHWGHKILVPQAFGTITGQEA